MRRKQVLALLMAMSLTCASVTGCGVADLKNNTVENEANSEEEKSDEDALLAAVTSVVNAGTSDANKEETVYVKANASGETESVIVSNWLKNTDSTKELTDVSELSDIKNVKGKETFSQDGEEITWEAEGSDIYYQGTTDKELPVDVAISYELDGESITPEELAGKSGQVKIVFDYTNNAAKTVEIGGKDETIYTPFGVVSGMLLDGDKFRNIEVSNGTVISDGNRQIVVGMAFPGLVESLNGAESSSEVLDEIEEKLEIPSSIEITADVTDFELGMTISMVSSDVMSSLGLDSIDTDDDKILDIKDSMNELGDASTLLVDGSAALQDGAMQLADGTSELVSGTSALYDGVVAYTNGVGQVVGGANALDDGASQLDNGVSTLKDGSAQLSNGAATLKDGTDQVNAGAHSLKDGLATADNGAKQLATGASSLSAGAAQVNDGVGQVATQMGTLQGAIHDQLLPGAQQISAGLQAAISSIGGAPQGKNVYESVEGEVACSQGNYADENTQSASGDIVASLVAAGFISEEDADAAASVINGSVQSQLNSAYGAGSAGAGEIAQRVVDETINECAEAGMGQLVAVLTQLKAGEDSLVAGLTQIDTNLTAAAPGLTQLVAGAKQVADGASSVDTNMKTLSGGISQLYTGSETLANGTQQVADGAGSLKDGAASLDSGVAALKSGTENLKAGTSTLVAGTNELNSNSKALVDGAGTLASGSAELVNGINLLKDGSITLHDGMVQFDEEGISKLTEAFGDDLGSLSERLKAVVDASKEYNTFTGANKNADSTVKFIIESAGIEK